MSRRACAIAASVVVMVVVTAGCLYTAEDGLTLRFSLTDSHNDEPVTVSVSGTVKDRETGKPIPEALVRGHMVVWRYLGPELFSKCPCQETRTNTNGQYQLTFTTPLTNSGEMTGQDGISVYASAPGYETRPESVRPEVTVERTRYTDIDIQLGPGRLVRGRLVNEEGDPIESAVIDIETNLNASWAYFGSLGRSYSDANGEFEIWCGLDREGLVGTKTWLEVFVQDYGMGHCLDFLEKEAVGDMVVPRGGTVVGRVVDAEGRAVEDCEVSAWFGREKIQETRTDASGDYVLEGIPGSPGIERLSRWISPAGGYRVSAQIYARSDPKGSLSGVPQCEVTARDGETMVAPLLVLGEGAGKTVWPNLDIRQSASVSGRLKPAGNTVPLEGLRVCLDSGRWDNYVTADAEGRFQFLHVPPGKHRVTVYLPTNLRGGRGIGRVDIEVEPRQVLQGLEIPLDEMAEVRVQLLDMNGDPLEGITAAAEWDDATSQQLGRPPWMQGTDSGPDGWAIVYTYAGFTQQVSGSVFNVPLPLVAEGYEVVTPEANEVVDNIRITMVPFASVHGRLTDGSSAPLSGKEVRCQFLYADGYEDWERAETDAAGNFAIKWVKPGVARLNVETDPPELKLSSGEAIEIRPGEEKNLGDIALEPVDFYRVSGKLLGSPSFQDLEGFRVRTRVRWHDVTATADSDGNFVFTEILSGSYELQACLPFDEYTRSPVGRAHVEVKDGNVDGVEIQLETWATVHLRIMDESGAPLEGFSTLAWFAENLDPGFFDFVNGSTSDSRGRAILFIQPNVLHEILARDPRGGYSVRGHLELTLKPGEVVDDFPIVMVKHE